MLFPGSMPMEDTIMKVPEGPGLGAEPDRGFLRESHIEP
jgi:L-alanine-DL-glutamate epimerase-like enolase superfamily enzyme